MIGVILAVGGVVCIAILAILYVKSRSKANDPPETGTFELVAPSLPPAPTAATPPAESADNFDAAAWEALWEVITPPQEPIAMEDVTKPEANDDAGQFFFCPDSAREEPLMF